MTLIYIFPAQSSRYPGMLHKLCELNPRGREILGAASDLLGRDLLAHYREDNREVFARNQDIQVGVFLANHLFLDQLSEAGIFANLSLGLSLGELNHLVHIGALDFWEALRVVDRRGQAYDAGPRGAMASVFPIELEELQAVAARASRVGVVEVVNLNSPRQHVISGERAAVDEALRLVEEETFAQAVIIERQVPMHCSIFEPVGQELRQVLEQADFAPPRLPYLPNRLGRILEDPTRENFVELLSTHVHSPVLFRDSIDFLVRRWPDAVFVEVGPRAVCYNLLDRKWHKNHKLHTDSVEDTAQHLEQVIAELAARQGTPALAERAAVREASWPGIH